MKESTKATKVASKKWQLSGEEEYHEQYKVKKRESKKAVAIAKENAYEDLYQKLDSREEERSRLNFRKESFPNRVVNMWNFLPEYVVNAPSVDQSRARVL